MQWNKYEIKQLCYFATSARVEELIVKDLSSDGVWIVDTDTEEGIAGLGVVGTSSLHSSGSWKLENITEKCKEIRLYQQRNN